MSWWEQIWEKLKGIFGEGTYLAWPVAMQPQQVEAGGQGGERQGGKGGEERAGGGQAGLVERLLFADLRLQYEMGRRRSATTWKMFWILSHEEVEGDLSLAAESFPCSVILSKPSEKIRR